MAHVNERYIRKALKQCFAEINARLESGAIYKHGTVMFKVERYGEDIAASVLAKHTGTQGLCEFFLHIDVETSQRRGFAELNLLVSEYATCIKEYECQKRLYVEIMETIDCVFPYTFNGLHSNFDDK